MREFTMKKIQIILSLFLFASTIQLYTMKRDHDQLINTSVESIHITYLPAEIITKIAVTCEPQARAQLALTNKYFNQWASIKNNSNIINHEEFDISELDRLYYLFYGCIHNLENLVEKALTKINPEEVFI